MLILPILIATGLAVSGIIYSPVGYILLGIAVIWIIVLSLPYLFPVVPRLEKAVKRSQTVWGLWWTGDRVRKKSLLKHYNSIKQIIVVEPNIDNEKMVEATRYAFSSVTEAINQVMLLTYEVYKKKQSGGDVEIKYINQWPEESYTIFDPNNSTVRDSLDFSTESWITVSVPWNVPVNKRRNLVYKKNTRDFMHYATKYESMWEKGRYPTCNEIEVAMKMGKSVEKTKRLYGITKNKFHNLLARALQPTKKYEKEKS